MRSLINSLLALLIVLGSSTSYASEELEIKDYKGWVVSVLGGDMIRVLDGSSRMTIVRLKGIDAPENDQPYGQEARDHLSGLVMGKEIKIKARKTDDFGNVLGRVLVEPPGCLGCEEDFDVNLSMLEQGLAWWASKFARQHDKKERRLYEDEERDARQAKRGLWQDSDPVAPWHWRDGIRSNAELDSAESSR